MSRTIADIPWPGPKPLSFEGDAAGASLAGRESELEELLDVCQTYAVVEITAPSGVGKTSFVAAARPYLERAGAEVAKARSPWGAVLAEYEARDPAAFEAHKAEPLYRLAMGIPDDSPVTDPSDLVEELRGRRPLVCVFDQLEELVRYWPQLGANLLELVARAAAGSGVPHVIIARTEYRDRLRPAEIWQAPTWHIFLKELTDRDTIRRIIEEPVPQGVSLETGVSDRLVDWWLEAREAGTSQPFDPGALRRTPTECGLLHLQALLASVRDWADARKEGEKRRRLTLDDLDAYVATRPLSDGTATGRGLVDHALRTHVETAVDGCRSKRWPNGPRLMFARAAGHLSSNGFKSAQPISALAVWALQEELGSSTGGRELRLSLGLEHAEDRLQQAAREFARRFQIEGAGVAHDWKAWRVAGEMVASLESALSTLADDEGANILRHYHHRGEAVYELVHDGMALGLNEWAKALLDSPIASLGGISARRGELLNFDLGADTFLDGGDVRPYWSAVNVAEQDRASVPAVERLKWYGLGVHHPEPGEGEARRRVYISGIRFRECVLKGTLFVSVTFRDVVFEACDMTGVAAFDCEFVDVSFVGCQLTGAAFNGSRFERVTFDCAGRPESMNYVSIEDAQPGAEVEIRALRQGSGLFLVGFGGGTWVLEDVELSHFSFQSTNRADVVLRLGGDTCLRQVTIDLPPDARAEVDPDVRVSLLTDPTSIIPEHAVTEDSAEEAG